MAEQKHIADDHEIHMPNNSWIPVAFSLSLALTLLGLIMPLWVLGIGLVCLVLTLVSWVMMARKEFLELPEHSND